MVLKKQNKKAGKNTPNSASNPTAEDIFSVPNPTADEIFNSSKYASLVISGSFFNNGKKRNYAEKKSNDKFSFSRLLKFLNRN